MFFKQHNNNLLFFPSSILGAGSVLIYAVLKKTVRSPEVCEFFNYIKNHLPN